MIKKLRLKFIFIALISVVFVLGTIVTAINIVNFSRVSNRADQILNILADNDGKFNNDPNQQPKNNNFREETPFETRYFTVKIENDTYTADTSHIAIISNEQAIEYAKWALSNGANGYKGSYRFLVSSSNNIVVFIDCTKDLETAKDFLKSSIVISVIGTVCVLILVIVLSKVILKPVEESYKKQKEFITNASHELKTPLTIISANNEIIELTTGESESTQVISKQVKRLTEMVKNLVALSRIDEASINANTKQFNLSNTLNNAIQPFSSTLTNNNKKLNINIDNDINYNGNENLIKQLFGILIENANKYSVGYVDIKLTNKDRKIVFEIKNDAQNIVEGNLNKVFERFYRLDEVRASGIEGSGIGLSVAKEIVALHKGKINAYGTKNNEFIIKIEF